jgi:hypothetical protein
MPFGRSARLGRSSAGRTADLGDTRRKTLNLGTFWGLFGKLIARLAREHAHAEVVLIMHEGQIKQVRVNRSYLPENLPDIPGE